MSLKKESRSNFVVLPSFLSEIEIVGLNIQKDKESNNSLFPILFQPFTSSYLWNFFDFSWFSFLTQSQSATVFCICTISFFCQHFKVLYLRHDLTDIDQTWSQVPVDHPIYVIWPDWGQRSRRGHRGQKGHFH